MTALPEGWVETTLGELAAGTGQSVNPQKFPDERFELFSVPSFENRCAEISMGSEIKSSKQAVTEGDVLLCKIVPHLNRVWVVTEPKGIRQIASGEWVRYNSKGLEPKYLCLYLSSPGFRTSFLQTVSGVGGSLSRARPKEFNLFSVPLPPLAEQKRIVEKLQALSARITAAKAHLDHSLTQATRAKQATIEQLDSENGALAKEWSVIPAKELFAWSSGRNLPKKQQKDGQYPVFGGNGIQGTHAEANVSTKTLIIGRVGAQCGNVHSTTEPCWITDNAIFATKIDSAVDLCFAKLVFRAANLNTKAGGTGQPYVNQGALNAVAFPKIPIEKQREIVTRIESAFAKIDAMVEQAQNALRLLERLEQQLLAKAFRGELVPQDPKDEPASALLARIRADRAAQSTRKPTKPKRARKPQTA